MVATEISFITFKSVCCRGHFFEVILPALKVPDMENTEIHDNK